MSFTKSSIIRPRYLNRVYILLFALLITSCNITRNVPDEKYLLNKSTIIIDSKDIKSGNIETYLRQKPNKRIIGFRFHLRVFNSANPYKYKGFNKWLKTIGEEPVILDTFLVNQSVQNINLYLQNKGYYQSIVNKSISYPKRKKANVTYSIKLGEPYKIKTFHYSIEDSTINYLVRKDSLNSFIKKRKPLDSDVLQDERSRIQAYLKNNGYYFFSKDNIGFDADTSVGKHKVDLQLNIKNRYILSENGERVPLNYLKYKINKVFFYPNYDPRRLVDVNSSKIDTTIYHGINFISTGDPGILYKVLDQSNQIRSGSIYSDDIVQQTQSGLNSLKLFRMINIFFAEELADTAKKSKDDNLILFEESRSKDTVPFGLLNCYVQLTSHTLQSYQAEFVGTNTSGAFGTEGNLSYQHKNLFRGAEIFDVKLRGLVETVQKNKDAGNLNFKYSLELGGSVGLSLPKFLSPFASRQFIKKYSPRTQIAASYNFQRRPDYTRTIASMLFGYVWKNSKFITHTVNPVEISAINITDISSSFQDQISGKYIGNSYKNQIITLSSYSLTLNNQNLQKNSSYTYLRLNFESSGNALAGIYSKYGTKSIDDSTYKILKTSFSQFLRSDVNITYHQVIDNNNTFVYRIFAGVGYPYGNSKALPFDKKYFSGGANGIRAWSARSLGPGSVKVENSGFFNQTGDIKLEANIEYRYKIFWQLEGALFFDAGNIWAFKDENDDAIFKPKTFYKQIALGTGTGFRANLGFLTARFDFGYKVYDPIIDPDLPFKPWVPFQQKFMWKDVAVNFGIGYPF
ncbi:MAG: hypothetical protein EHM93_17845 [Bacteroidales bacterium]|nr:MAG: hypothetical protein EHM93_17845 [Bacteroidales bacterium]